MDVAQIAEQYVVCNEEEEEEDIALQYGSHRLTEINRDDAGKEVQDELDTVVKVRRRSWQRTCRRRVHEQHMHVHPVSMCYA